MRSRIHALADECAAGRSDGVSDDARRANARAASEQNARENEKKKCRVFHYTTVINDQPTWAAPARARSSEGDARRDLHQRASSNPFPREVREGGVRPLQSILGCE